MKDRVEKSIGIVTLIDEVSVKINIDVLEIRQACRSPKAKLTRFLHPKHEETVFFFSSKSRFTSLSEVESVGVLKDEVRFKPITP